MTTAYGRNRSQNEFLFWIESLKFARYEAESIVPFVANSPVMSFFYHHPAPDYRPRLSKEGEVHVENQRWHEANGTYTFSNYLGSAVILIGLLTASHPFFPRLAAAGSLLLILVSLNTLSFLLTTPEAWVPALGSTTHEFPHLSGAGRLVVKDFIMLGGAVVTLADSAQAGIRRNRFSV